MSLLLLLLKASAFNAILLALSAGMVAGVGVYLVGSIIAVGSEPATPPPPVEAPKPAQPDETKLFSAQDLTSGAGLDQTVRIEPGTLDLILPEISPEQVLKEREGLDIGALEEGIEASRKAREDSMMGNNQGDTK